MFSIAEGETVVGVRLSCEFSFPAGEGSETRLYLLRIVDGSLVRLFGAQMAFNDYQRGPNDETHGSAVLVVNRARQEDFADLTLKETVLSSPLIADHKRTTKKTSLHHFQFHAGKYRELGR